MKRKVYYVLLLILNLEITFTYGQSNIPSDTLVLSLQDAENLFLKQNLSLLAGKCNVEAARAMIIQARLFNNPSITVEQGVFDPATKKFFDVSSSGNTDYTIQQLFYLAGKRNKRVQLEKINTQKQEYLFYDLVRTLSFQLKTNFNNIYFQLQSLKVYEKEIASLQKLIQVSEEQYKKGYLSNKDLIRLKSTLFLLESDRLAVSENIMSLESDLSLLLHKPHVFILPQINESAPSVALESLNFQSLNDTAIQNRADLKAAEEDLKWNEMNFRYQKAVAIPDLTLSGVYSKQGSYVNDYNAISLAIDLPFFNRNQGNIKAAKFQVDNSKYTFQNATDEVKADVLQAFKKVLENEALYKSFNIDFYKDFDKMLEEVTKNYEKRNISLLEFMDFYSAYKESTNQLNAFMCNRLNAFEELNFSVGKNIIHY